MVASNFITIAAPLENPGDSMMFYAIASHIIALPRQIAWV